MARSPAVLLAIAFAQMEARARGLAATDPDHLWMGLCRVAEVVSGGRTDRLSDLTPEQLQSLEHDGHALLQWLAERHVQPTIGRRAMRDRLVASPDPPSPTQSPDRLTDSPALQAVFGEADRAAASSGHRQTQLAHVADALAAAPTQRLQRVLALALATADDAARDPHHRPAAAPTPTPAAKTEAELPELIGSIGRDLTKMARAGQLAQMIGRKSELKRLVLALSQQRKNCPILVGEPGVGKTQIVMGLAGLIASPKCPPHLRDVRLVEIQPANLIAGTGMRGDLEKRVGRLLKEAASDRRIVLFIDEVHTLMAAGKGDGSLDIGNMLKPALADGSLRMIGATTTEEYDRFMAADAALERRFESVHVDEPDRDEAVAILQGLSGRMQQHYALAIQPAAIEAAVDLSIRFDASHRLPDKAIDLLDQACATRALGSFSLSADGSSIGPTRGAAALAVDRDAIVDAVVERLRLPRELVTADDLARVRWLEKTLGERVLGQDDAISAIGSTLRAAYRGLRGARRPIASFLLHGPTGVGKTETARALAEILFGDADRLVRLDMSEYGERHEVARLLGAPPGYQGHDQPGQLSVPLRNTPACVVLFDEIEKAHPDVLQILLQVLDEGELTDSRGRKLRFRETVVILTTNLVPRRVDERGNSLPPQDAFRPSLRPELLGRLSSVIEYRQPDRAALQAVARRTLQQYAARVQFQGAPVVLPESIADQVVRELGDAPAFGMRDLQHHIERAVAAHLEELSMQRRNPAAAISGELAVPAAAMASAVEQPADAMLRSDAGSIFQLRARRTLSVGRHEEAGWMVRLAPHTDENQEKSRAIGRHHLLVHGSTSGFAVEDAGSRTGTVVNAMPLAPGVRRHLEGGETIDLGNCLQLRATVVPDRHLDIRMVASTVRPAPREDAIGYGEAGDFRSMLLHRINNRPEECCVCIAKYACIGSSADCEIVVANTAPVACELRILPDAAASAAAAPPAGQAGQPMWQFQLVALIAGVRYNDGLLARGATVALAHEDRLAMPGARETLVFLRRHARRVADN